MEADTAKEDAARARATALAAQAEATQASREREAAVRKCEEAVAALATSEGQLKASQAKLAQVAELLAEMQGASSPRTVAHGHAPSWPASHSRPGLRASLSSGLLSKCSLTPFSALSPPQSHGQSWGRLS
jgi:hypothetical protein